MDDGPRLHHRLSSEVAFCFNGELEPARTGDVVRAPTPPPGGLRKQWGAALVSLAGGECGAWAGGVGVGVLGGRAARLMGFGDVFAPTGERPPVEEEPETERPFI